MDAALAAVLAAVLAAGISAFATVLVARMDDRISEIHVMVNSNLEAAKKEKTVAVETLAQLNQKHSEIIATVASETAKSYFQALLAEYILTKKPDPPKA